VVGSEIHTTVKIGGELSNNKGINRQGGGLTAPALTAKDMEDIKTAMSFQADYLAVSFPKTPPTWKWRASWPISPASRSATSR
jgi:pyruvate kinase